MKYNGHRSWNAWNISLWLNNEEPTYRYMVSLVQQYGRRKAARLLANELAGQSTPDGARYNKTCIYEAMEDLT